MNKYLLFSLLMFTFSLLQFEAEAQRPANTMKSRKELDSDGLPRASAFEVYTKYMSGKAIIIHAGGQDFRKRHIMGAIDFSSKNTRHPELPKKNFEIFVYCY